MVVVGFAIVSGFISISGRMSPKFRHRSESRPTVNLKMSRILSADDLNDFITPVCRMSMLVDAFRVKRALNLSKLIRLPSTARYDLAELLM